MGELMNKEIDSSWNCIYVALNEEVFRSRMIWRVAEAAYYNGEIQDKRTKQYGEGTEWILEHFPEMAFVDVRGEETYSILPDIWNIVENAVEKQGVSDHVFSGGREFDVLAYASEDVDICRKYMKEGEEDADKVILFAAICFMAESYGKLYVEREKEILSILGVRRREIVEDDYLESEGIPREEILKLSGNRDEEDPRMKKMMRTLKTLQIPKKREQKISQGSEDTGAGQEEKDTEREKLRELLVNMRIL